jgi:hypothetical protein
MIRLYDRALTPKEAASQIIKEALWNANEPDGTSAQQYLSELATDREMHLITDQVQKYMSRIHRILK